MRGDEMVRRLHQWQVEEFWTAAHACPSINCLLVGMSANASYHEQVAALGPDGMHVFATKPVDTMVLRSILDARSAGGKDHSACLSHLHMAIIRGSVDWGSVRSFSYSSSVRIRGHMLDQS